MWGWGGAFSPLASLGPPTKAWRQRKIEKGCDKDLFKENKAFDAVSIAVRVVRRDFARSLRLDLPEVVDSDPPSESEAEDEEEDRPSQARKSRRGPG